MTFLNWLLDATGSPLVLGFCSIVVALVGALFIALVGHLVMGQVRKTRLGKRAGDAAHRLASKARAAHAARSVAHTSAKGGVR